MFQLLQNMCYSYSRTSVTVTLEQVLQLVIRTFSHIYMYLEHISYLFFRTSIIFPSSEQVSYLFLRTSIIFTSVEQVSYFIL